MRYHINPETCRPNICRAQSPESCLYYDSETQTESPHFETKEEARAYVGKELDKEFAATKNTLQKWNEGIFTKQYKDLLRKEVEHMDKRKQELKEEFTKLEEQYKDRKLEFYNTYGGCCPMQIYGSIDGDKFYWRTRGNTTSIKVGPYNKKLDEAVSNAQKRVAAEKLAKHKETCVEDDCFECHFLQESVSRPEPNLPNSYHPLQVTKVASINNLVEGDEYKGELDPEEVADIFSKLLGKLEKVETVDQISPFTLAGLGDDDKVKELYAITGDDEAWDKMKTNLHKLYKKYWM